MMRRRLLLVLLLALAGTAQAEQTLVYCPASAPVSLNPQLAIDQATFDATAGTVYDRLVQLEPGTTRVVPDLATSWTVTENGRVYTFKLRHNVQFQQTPWFKPSRPFDADDVVFSFERQWRRDNPYHHVSGGSYRYFIGMGLQRRLLAIDKLDDYTVRFTLQQPDTGFLAILALPFASILSEEYAAHLLVNDDPAQLDRQPVGTGPFKLSGQPSADRLEFTANPDYWAGRPALDRLIFDIVPDPDERLRRLDRGQCDVLPPLSRAQLRSWRMPRGVRLLQRTGFDVAYLAFNTRRPPFSDPRVRRALSLAVNRQAIINTVYGKTGVLANDPLPPTSWAYADDVKPLPYDPAAARKLLAAAGVPKDFHTVLWVMPVSRYYMPDPLQVARMIRADWVRVGVDAQLLIPDWNDFLARSRQGEHATILLGWTGDDGDPDNFLTPLLSCSAIGGGNRARWCDSDFQELLHQARIIAAPSKRRALYLHAQAVFRAQLPWLPLAHSVYFQPLRERVRGFMMGALGGSYFYGVTMR